MNQLFSKLFKVMLTLMVLLSGIAVAQDDINSKNKTEEESHIKDIITVRAMRRAVPVEALPNTIRLIESEDIAAQSLFSTSLVDIVGQKVPSFSPSRQKLTGVSESFRGREPLYLIDGVPQSNPLRNGSRDGFTIDPAVVERVEVLFGANAIQGIGATGGVINYVTLSPSNEDRWQFRTEAQTMFTGDFGDGTGYRGAVTALRDFGSVDLVASLAVETRGAFYDAKGRRIGIDSIQGDIQDSQSINLFAKAGWDLDERTRLQVMANLFKLEGDGAYVQVKGDRKTSVPATSIRGDQEGQAPTNKANTFSVEFMRDDLLGGDLTIQGFYRKFEAVYGGGRFGGFWNTGTEPPGVKTFDQSANNSNKTGAKLTYSKSNLPIDGLTVTGGIDWLHDKTFQALIQTARLWVPEVEFSSIAPFIQFDQLLFDDRILISAGVRYENASLKVDDYKTIFYYGAQHVGGGKPKFSKTLFNVGSSFEVVDGVTIYTSFAEGFTMPDVGRVLRAVKKPGQDVDTLLSVKPIIADNTELGISIRRGNFTANAAYFWSKSKFGQRLLANAQNIFEIRREPTKISGFELSSEYAFDKEVIIGASYAYLKGQSDQDGDGAIDEDLSAENISPNRLNLYLVARPSEAWILRAQVTRLMDRTFNDTSTVTDFEGYTLVDLSSGYDFGRFGRIDAGIQNAFNEEYVTYYSQAAASAATRGNRFFTGRGRAITIKWSKDF